MQIEYANIIAAGPDVPIADTGNRALKGKNVLDPLGAWMFISFLLVFVICNYRVSPTTQIFPPLVAGSENL